MAGCQFRTTTQQSPFLLRRQRPEIHIGCIYSILSTLPYSTQSHGTPLTHGLACSIPRGIIPHLYAHSICCICKCQLQVGFAGLGYFRKFLRKLHEHAPLRFSHRRSLFQLNN